jgi:hypothetical protein
MVGICIEIVSVMQDGFLALNPELPCMDPSEMQEDQEREESIGG